MIETRQDKTRCDCGSTDIDLMEDIGSDVYTTEAGGLCEERQHIEHCNKCGLERFRCDQFIQENGEGFTKLHLGRWTTGLSSMIGL